MVLELIVTLAVFISSVVLLTFASDKAVEPSLKIASAMRVSPLIIGLLVVSIGTDLPGIINSIVSCATGQEDINIGDALGSALTQMTLVLGLLPFFGGTLKVKKMYKATRLIAELFSWMVYF